MALKTFVAGTVAAARRLVASAPRSVFEPELVLVMAVVVVTTIMVSFLTPCIN